jgi:hypothetical protein
MYFNPVSWAGVAVNQGKWLLADQDGKVMKELTYGILGGIPVTGDWNGDGVTKVGVFVSGIWFLDLNGDGLWDTDDLWIQLGRESDQPVAGDWDGDGKADIGVFGMIWSGDSRALEHEPGLPDVQNRTSASLVGRYKNVPPSPEQATDGVRTLKRTSVGKFRKDLIDHVFAYGTEGDRPIAGDFNGDGVANIGVFRDGRWYIDADGNGKWSEGDIFAEYGQPGDRPVVGDWTGDGKAKLGVYRNGTWYLDTNNNRVLDPGDKVIRDFGGPNDTPVAGDWNGDGIDKPGLYREELATPQRQATDAAAPDDAATASNTPIAEPPPAK